MGAESDLFLFLGCLLTARDPRACDSSYNPYNHHHHHHHHYHHDHPPPLPSLYLNLLPVSQPFSLPLTFLSFFAHSWLTPQAILQSPSSQTLLALSHSLSSASPPIKHHLWIEEPEHEPTALAIIPNKREKKLKKILDGGGVELWR